MSDCPYDPFSSAVLENPFPAYRNARTECPVHHLVDHDTPFYTAFRYADVVDIVMNPEVWTARYGLSPKFQHGVGFNQDGAEHQKFRKAVVQTMTPRNLKELEPRIHQCTDDLLDAMGQHGSGDFHDLLACPLPVWVIGQLLGVTGSLDRFKDLSDALMHEGMNNTDPKKFLAVLAELDEYWADQLAGRRKVLSAMDPDEIGPHLLGEELPDDMISRLLVFRADDGRLLTEFEISNTLMNLLLAGNETTTSLLTNLVWRLLEDRSRWEALLEDRSLLPGAIEESLRYDAPTLGMFRTSTTDTTLDGTPIPAMSKIQANYAAANHDPEIFDHPDEFRIDRPRSESLRHLAFGRGTHACPGASLSRIETMIAMEKLLDRFPDLRLDGPSERITPFNFWGRRILPVAW